MPDPDAGRDRPTEVKAEQRVGGEGPAAPEPAADEGRSVLADVASTLADIASPVMSAVDHLATEARRMVGERPGARVRRVRRMGRQPLANLWDLHPEGRRASIRELGLLTVPVDQIAGTAVEGPQQRGGDFLPLRDRRGDDWRARWQRILRALDALETLPPIELIRFGDQYWVVDGHNRVAAALYNGQAEIDADVVELRLPGMKGAPTPTDIAPVLEGSLELRAAGAGLLSRTAGRPLDRPAVRPASSPDERHGQATDSSDEPAE